MTRIALIKVGVQSVRRAYAPPIGIMSLAAYLRQETAAEIQLTDMPVEGLGPEDVARKALAFEPDLVGISAMSYEAGQMARVAAEIKKRKPGITIVSGGPHATTSPNDAMEIPELDYIVMGEGELTFIEFLDSVFHDGGAPSGVKGLGFRENGHVRLNERREEIVDLDSIPLPAYDLIDLPRYWDLPRFGTVYVNREYATLSTSRACPFQCTYCHRIFGTRFRAQSAEKVLQDLETLVSKHGVREYQFVDDCFNLDKKRVRELCDAMVERGLTRPISFPNGVRGDIMTPEVLDSLKKAGVYRLTYAIETASPRLQEFIKKRVKLERLQEVITMTDARDIMVDGFFMVGFPGETREEVEMTLKYALDSRLHTANFWFVTPFKGTELHRQATELGYELVEKDDSLHYFDPATDLSEVPADELKKMVTRTFFRFYLNPWRMYRILGLFPNKWKLPALFLRYIKLSLKWN